MKGEDVAGNVRHAVQDAGLGHVEMSDRDAACGILPDLDYEAQLIAISALLRRNDQDDARLNAK